MKKLHWAFIMDGNGRWASMRGLSRQKGHTEGVKTARKVIDYCLTKGNIGVVSLYVFSTENWLRPPSEVNGLFKLAKEYLVDTDSFKQKGIKVVFSGERTNLPKELLDLMDACALKTAQCGNLTLNLCINYGGRAEIIRAAKLLKDTNFSEAQFKKQMYQNLPYPDLILRTGGQMRLSNFMLFQAAYAELFFSDTLWPDITPTELDGVLDAFNHRTRNFGKIRETNENQHV
jgi:undecaprenyl diphosphate synthase